MRESDERFLAIGDETVADLRDLADLREDDRVLDVGCGYGRLAHALIRDSSFEGTYLGLDIIDGPIRWCQDELAPSSGGSVEFRHLDVANARYNPEGTTPSRIAELGVEPEAFDVITLISVFTHLEPKTIKRYLAQVAQALAPGGRAMISVFLLDKSWEECEESGISPIPLPHRLTAFCRYQDEEDPLAAIGYTPRWIVRRAREAGLERIGPPRLGVWCGRPDGVGFQDLLVLGRIAEPA